MWFFQHPLFSFIIALVVLGPIAKGIGERLARGRPSLDGEALKKALNAAEQRLAEAESRLATVEDKMDFYEKLMKTPAKPRLPGQGDAGAEEQGTTAQISRGSK